MVYISVHAYKLNILISLEQNLVCFMDQDLLGLWWLSLCRKWFCWWSASLTFPCSEISTPTILSVSGFIASCLNKPPASTLASQPLVYLPHDPEGVSCRPDPSLSLSVENPSSACLLRCSSAPTWRLLTFSAKRSVTSSFPQHTQLFWTPGSFPENTGLFRTSLPIHFPARCTLPPSPVSPVYPFFKSPDTDWPLLLCQAHPVQTCS